MASTDVDDEPTLAQTELMDVAAGHSGTRHAATTQLASALRTEELVRTRALLRVVAPVSVLGLAAMLFTREDLVGRTPSAVVVGATFVVTIALLLYLRDSTRFRPAFMLVYGLLCTASIMTSIVFFGVFSPAIMASCVGIYFFGMGDSRKHAWIIYVVGAISYLALTVLAFVHVLPLDRSVAPIDRPQWIGLSALSVIAQVILGLTFWLALRSRQATRDAFEQVVRAGTKLRERDAVLAEVRADLDIARRSARGRYTGKMLGPYQIDEVIGRGAMGEVYRGVDVEGSRPVAVKVLSAATSVEPHVVERFVRESRIAMSVHSPYVVEIYGTGPTDDGGQYLAMELLEGEDLAAHLRKVSRLSANDVVELVREIGQALASGDEAGIVHRDVKPQNIFRVATPKHARWKVLDFGVSKLREAVATITHNQIVGTPSYMAPEQARGGEVDHRADVFALGSVAYRAITGRPAFTGADAATTIYNVLYIQPARPAHHVELPADVEGVLALALAKDPAERFQTTGAFAAALRDAYRGQLDLRFREAARRLLARQPWGADSLRLRRRRPDF